VGAYYALRALQRRWREADAAEADETQPYAPRGGDAS
jgi:hypothetical protein